MKRRIRWENKSFDDMGTLKVETNMKPARPCKRGRTFYVVVECICGGGEGGSGGVTLYNEIYNTK